MNSAVMLNWVYRLLWPKLFWRQLGRNFYTGPGNPAVACCYVNIPTYNTLQPFNGLFSRTTWVSRYQKGKTNLDLTEARDSEWQWHQLGHMHVCTSLQTDNHASTPPLCFLQAGCPSCRPTNSVKALNDTEYVKKWHRDGADY